MAKEIPSDPIAETDTLLVIKDINPRAPIHYLIIPKKHLKDIRDFSGIDKELAGDIILMAKNLSKDSGEFKLVSNNGKSVGQSVFHSHFHFLAGKEMSDF